MPQQFHAGDNAVLAKRKSANAMITASTQPPRTLVALDDRWILGVICAIQHLLLSVSLDRYALLRRCSLLAPFCFAGCFG